MKFEIERKFLVKNRSFIEDSFRVSEICQGFLNSDKNRVVRVRTIDDHGFLTIKGISDKTGVIRKEWEYEIPKQEAQELLTLCEPHIIEKKRYYCRHKQHLFEIDVFLNKNEGLVIAEIELNHDHETFERPNWLGNEVTGIEKYYNNNLSKNPYIFWK